MPTLAGFDKCTGCGACADSCHSAAISLVPQLELGHLYPRVDSSKCVECKACEKSCSVLQDSVELRFPQKCFAVWAKDYDENLRSTSGGAATVFSKRILADGGVVYGCGNDGVLFRHVRVDVTAGIERLRGSKYVQSDVRGAYRNVRKDLTEGRKVLFIGTPCQVAGLRTFLRRDYDNLIAVDIICHGVPSVQLLCNHLERKVRLGDVSKISFRDGGFILRACDKWGKVMYQSNLWKERYEDAYYTAFIKGYSYRESCYSCPYARPKRCGDITIGDFWGLGKLVPFETSHPNAGFSVALANTELGLDFLLSQEDTLYICERQIDEALDGNPQLRAPMKKSASVKLFRCLVRKGFSLKMALYTTDFYLLPVYWILNKLRKRFEI